MVCGSLTTFPANPAFNRPTLVCPTDCPQICEYENCRILLVDKKISTAREIIGILESAIKVRVRVCVRACETPNPRTDVAQAARPSIHPPNLSSSCLASQQGQLPADRNPVPAAPQPTNQPTTPAACLPARATTPC